MFGFSSDKIQGQVTDLVEQLKTNANLSDEQTKQVVATIKTFVVDKYPMLRGAVEGMFGK